MHDPDVIGPWRRASVVVRTIAIASWLLGVAGLAMILMSGFWSVALGAWWASVVPVTLGAVAWSTASGLRDGQAWAWIAAVGVTGLLGIAVAASALGVLLTADSDPYGIARVAYLIIGFVIAVPFVALARSLRPRPVPTRDRATLIPAARVGVLLVGVVGVGVLLTVGIVTKS